MRGFFDFEKSNRKLVAVLITPTLILVLGVVAYPLIYSFVMSFGDVEFANIKDYDFVAFQQYIKALTDPEFINSIKVSAKFVFFTVLIKLVLGTLIAVLLKEKFVGRSLARALIIIPWATPFVVVGIMWRWMLHSQVGIINFLLYKLGIISEYIPFLSTKTFAMPCVILADVWQGTPFFVIIILAGLQTIPEDLYEASKIDGAGGIKSFFFITLPMVKFPIFISTILGTIFAINAFDLFFVLTRGGPANITTSATLFNWNNAFKFYHLSYASAISYVILVIAMIITVVYIIILRRSEIE
ncbi:MAG: sugar ABC transporter permease [Actinobacteria bacterium]|nr:sugar ABC transporter permease [Actinomycetota bacterium]MBL7123431.1 sugar ABC transporter permease [Actinomycetota bacterium]